MDEQYNRNNIIMYGIKTPRSNKKIKKKNELFNIYYYIKVATMDSIYYSAIVVRIIIIRYIIIILIL